MQIKIKLHFWNNRFVGFTTLIRHAVFFYHRTVFLSLQITCRSKTGNAFCRNLTHACNCEGKQHQ